MLRRPLVFGAAGRLRDARRNPEAADWATWLLARRPFEVVAVAKKMTRIAWALLARRRTYTTTTTTTATACAAAFELAGRRIWRGPRCLSDYHSERPVSR